MNKLLKQLIPLTFLFGSTTALAQGPGWTANSNIEKIVFTYSGAVNVKLSPALSGCVSDSGYGELYATLYPDHPGFQALSSALVYAKATKTPIALYLFDDKCKIAEMELGGR